MTRAAVQRSAEFERIAALPSRVWEPSDLEGLADKLTALYRMPHGNMRLFPIQAQMLADALEVGGLFAMTPVGSGKTLASFLVPQILEAERPVLMVPASLKDKTQRDMRDLARHWAIHPRITMISYEQLSQADAHNLLDRLNPDLILADEAHKLRHRRTARTRRFLRFMGDREADGRPVKFAAFSGSQFRRHLREMWHLLGLALPQGAPIPYHWPTVEEWGLALDAKVDPWQRPHPGVLLSFAHNADVMPGDELSTARKGYGRRLTSTWGVVTTTGDNDLGCSLQLIERMVTVPDVITDALRNLSATWETPNGDELEWAPAVWRIARELACGMFYRWSPPPENAWLDPRRAWHKFVRSVLKQGRPGLDSPLQIARAFPDHPLHLAWNAVHDQYDPEDHKVAVWLDDFMVRDAAAWADKHGGIVWVEHGAVGRAIAAATGLRYYAGGDRDNAEINVARGPIIASIKANSEGKNLQDRYSRMLVTSAPPSNDVWEQLIGRVHRPGQEADEVAVEFYLHGEGLRDGFLASLEEARFLRQITSQQQKLLLADKIVNSVTLPGLTPA